MLKVTLTENKNLDLTILKLTNQIDKLTNAIK
jgi:hypothetical protein